MSRSMPFFLFIYIAFTWPTGAEDLAVQVLAPRSDFQDLSYDVFKDQDIPPQLKKTVFVIMAGGQSSRLGRNKPAEEIEGVSTYERLLFIAQLLRVPRIVTVASPTRPDWVNDLDAINAKHSQLKINMVIGDQDNWMPSLVKVLKDLSEQTDVENVVLLQGDHIPDLSVIAEAVFSEKNNLLFVAQGVEGANHIKSVADIGNGYQTGERIAQYDVNYHTWDGGEAVVGWLIRRDMFESIVYYQNLEAPISSQLEKWRVIRSQYPYHNPNTPEEMVKLKEAMSMGRNIFGFSSGAILPSSYAKSVLQSAFGLDEEVELISSNFRNSVWKTSSGKYLKIYTSFKDGDGRFLRELFYAQHYSDLSVKIDSYSVEHRAVLMSDFTDGTGDMKNLYQILQDVAGQDVKDLARQMIQSMSRFHGEKQTKAGWLVEGKPQDGASDYFSFEMKQFEALKDSKLSDYLDMQDMNRFRDKVNRMPYVTNHGDYVPYNIFWQQGTIQKIIDGEQQISAPAMRDLGIMIVRLLEIGRVHPELTANVSALIREMIQLFPIVQEKDWETLSFFLMREWYQDIHDTYLTTRDYLRLSWSFAWISEIKDMKDPKTFDWEKSQKRINEKLEIAHNFIFNKADQVLEEFLKRKEDKADSYALDATDYITAILEHLKYIDLNALKSAVWLLKEIQSRGVFDLKDIPVELYYTLKDEHIRQLFDSDDPFYIRLHGEREKYFFKELDKVMVDLVQGWDKNSIDVFLVEPKKFNEEIYAKLPVKLQGFYPYDELLGKINQYRVKFIAGKIRVLADQVRSNLEAAKGLVKDGDFHQAKYFLDQLRGVHERLLEASYYNKEFLNQFYEYSQLWEEVQFHLGSYEDKVPHMMVISTFNNPMALHENLEHIKQELESFHYFKYAPKKFRVVIVEDSTEDVIGQNRAVIDQYRDIFEISYWDHDRQRALAQEKGMEYWINKDTGQIQFGGKGYGGARNMMTEVEKEEVKTFPPQTILITHFDQDNKLGVMVLNDQNNKEHVHAFNYFERLQGFYKDGFQGIIHGDYSEDVVEGIEGLLSLMDIYKFFGDMSDKDADQPYALDPDKRWYRRVPHSRHPQIVRYGFSIMTQVFALQNSQYLPYIPNEGEMVVTMRDYFLKQLQALQKIMRGRYENRESLYHPMTYETQETGDLRTYQIVSNAFGGNTTITSDHLAEQIPYMPFLPRGEDIVFGVTNSIVRGPVIHLVNALEIAHQRWSKRMDIKKEMRLFLNQRIYFIVLERVIESYFRTQKGIAIRQGDIYPHEASLVVGQLNEEQLADMLAHAGQYVDLQELADFVTNKIIPEAFNYFKAAARTYEKIQQEGFLEDEKYWWNRDAALKPNIQELGKMLQSLSEWGNFEQFITGIQDDLIQLEAAVKELETFGTNLSVFIEQRRSERWLEDEAEFRGGLAVAA